MVRSRRSFLKGSFAAAAAMSVTPTLRAVGANDRLVVGVIGCGSQGRSHIDSLEHLKNVEIAYLCDPDSDRVAAAVKKAGRGKPVGDFRHILDDKSVDAVTIATPDHWHGTAAILAIEAGKHVYVEKPFAHNHREGRLLLDAARRHKRVVQHGTQARSSAGMRSAIQMLHDGVIGKIMAAKAWNIQRRSSIGHAKPSNPPAELDHDMWVGPAEMMPFQSNRYHYKWRWWHNYGCGDMGNDGIHHIDYARWGLGVDTLPTRVAAIGGKYFFDDDQQFPDTQQVVFEYPGDGKVGSKRMLIYEQRLWSVTYPFNVDSGAEFYGTKGEMFLSSRGKIRILGAGNRRINKKPEGSLKASSADHHQNWIDCIREGGRPHADADIGFKTAAVVHLGNIATRLGRTLEFDPEKEQFANDDEANALLKRKYRKEGHWAIPKYV